jgi:hypothetical protein
MRQIKVLVFLCMYSWEECYYQSLIRDNVSLLVISWIVISHFFCCTHSLDVFYALTIQSSTHHNITHQLSTMRNLYTPFHSLIFIESEYNQTIYDNTLPNTAIIHTDWIQKVSTVATNDPFTFIYDQIVQSSESRYATPTETPTSKTQCNIKPLNTSSENIRQYEDQHVDVIHIFHMYLIVIISFVSVWLPSVYIASQNYSSLTWVNLIITPSVMYITFMISWLIHSFVSQQLSSCVAMHMTIRHLIALHTTDILAYNTPTPAKHILCVIYPLAILAILIYISNASNTTLANFNTSTFYMCHMWSILCCEMMRALPLNILLHVFLTTSRVVIDDN